MLNIPEKESETIEFKLSFQDEVIQSLVAFSNAKGGIVYVGMNDNGLITGVSVGKETVQQWINEIKTKDFITVGRIIKIREADAEEAGGQKSSKAKRGTRQTPGGMKKAFLTYQVKKGDTIEVIAKRHHISPDDLLSFNNMSRSDRLIADKKLKIPQ